MERDKGKLVRLPLPDIEPPIDEFPRPRHPWLFPSLVVTTIGLGLLNGARPNWITDVENFIDSLGIGK